MALRHSADIALRALLAGCPVQLPGHPLPIIYAPAGKEVHFPSQSGELIEPAILYVMEDGRHLGCEISLTDFCREAEKLTQEACVLLAGNTALHSMRKPRRQVEMDDASDLAPGADSDGPGPASSSNQP